MKRNLIIIPILMMLLLCLTGCSGIEQTPNMLENTSNTSENVNISEDITTSENKMSTKKYNIGDEIILGDVEFNVYKIDSTNNEIYLLAKKNIATTRFSDEERDYKEEHDYEGSLIEDYVRKFVDGLEDKGYDIKSSGIIDKDDLYDLGFVDSVTVSGRPYLCDNVPEFVKYETNYWLDGYYRVDTYAWVYFDEKIDTKNCEDEYGVRPVIVINESEIGKEPKELNPNLNIKEIVNSDCAWTSEGGISNPYDRFYFDCENMLLKYVFESYMRSDSREYSMQFIDEKTIKLSGVKTSSEFPAELTIVDENKLRIRFLDDVHNNGDYFLNKISEAN